MIQFSDNDTLPLVKSMWKTCFDDTDEYISLIFDRKYKHENTLLYMEDCLPVAALQMMPYTLSFYGETVSFSYLAGLCTLPEYRGRGYMAELIHHSHRLMEEREIALSLLVPADEWLFGYYNRFGYEQVTDKSNEPIASVKDIIDTSGNIEDAYRTFDTVFNKQNLTVQKDLADFVTIVDEMAMEDFPPKYNLAAMARIIDARYLFDIYAQKHQSADFNGFASFDLRRQCRLIFGYRTDELGQDIARSYSEEKATVNLMLE